MESVKCVGMKESKGRKERQEINRKSMRVMKEINGKIGRNAYEVWE